MKIKLPWTKERLVFPMVRVDDRLLHGQVIIGWGQMLGLRPVLLASDRVVKETSLAETFRDILPPELEGGVVTLAEAAERWVRGDFKDQHALIVVEAPVDALKLLNLDAPMKVLTLGGLHYREDRDELLPYIYLSDWDRTALEEIRKRGVKIICQDLPTAKPVIYEE
jgi:mannose/fructose/N-acetylgalactosamine-specific phosphotransferase system component IIB